MNGHYTLKFCFLCLGIVCAATSLHPQCHPEGPFENDKFSARSSPATVTQESADSLKQKGYFLIATVTVENNLETFWGDKISEEEQRRSVNARGQKDLTPKLLDMAASCGGDMVTQQENNSLQFRGKARDGRCLSSRAETDWETSYIPSPHQVEVHRIICEQREMVGGTQWYVHSVGSVWRLEPGLDKAIAERKEKDRILHTEHFRDERGALKRFNLHDKWGFEDESGSTVIQPQFDFAGPFVDGLALVRINGKFGFINTTGAFVVSPQFEDAPSFADGLAAVKINGKYGYLDTTGAITINPQFEAARSFDDGLALVEIKGKYGYIDRTGAFAVKPQFDDVGWEFFDGLARVKINGKYGYIDRTRAIAVKPEFAQAGDFSEGLAWVTLDGQSPQKWGYIDTKGAWVIQPQFIEAHWFKEGVAAVGIAYDGQDEDKEHGARKYLSPPKPAGAISTSPENGWSLPDLTRRRISPRGWRQLRSEKGGNGGRHWCASRTGGISTRMDSLSSKPNSIRPSPSQREWP